MSGSEDETLRVWDLETGACLAILAANEEIKTVASSSELLAIGTTGGQVLFVEMPNLPPVPLAPSVAAPDSSDAAYEGLLRRSYEYSLREMGFDHCDTEGHRLALAALLQRMGKTDEAVNLRQDLRQPPQDANENEGNLNDRGADARVPLPSPIPRGQQMEIKGHLAELSREMIPGLLVWIALTMGGLVVLSGAWVLRAALSGMYALTLAYPVLCVGLWRFTAPGLHKRERVFFAIGLLLSAPILWALHFLFRPVDAAWSSVWHEAGQYPVLSVSRPFLYISCVFFGAMERNLQKAELLRTRVWYWALILVLLLVPSLASALALDVALAWLSVRTLSRRLWSRQKD